MDCRLTLPFVTSSGALAPWPLDDSLHVRIQEVVASVLPTHQAHASLDSTAPPSGGGAGAGR